MMGRRLTERFTLPQALLAVLAGYMPSCSRSGQTGSPSSEEPPDYVSPTRFTPEGGGTSTEGNGGLGGGEGFPFRNPTQEPRGFTQIVGDTLVVAALPEDFNGRGPAPRERGLLFYDVSDPAAPELSGELDVPGTPLKLYVEADAVTLIVEQNNTAEYAELPAGEVRVRVTRMLRIDTSDPSAPSIVGQIDLPGGYARSYEFAGRLVVATDLAQEPLFSCELAGGNGLLIPEIFRFVAPRVNFGLTSVEWDGSEFVVRDSLEREGLHQVEDGQDGRLAIESLEFDAEENLSSSLLLVQVSETDGAFVVSEPVPMSGEIETARLQGDALNVAVETETGSQYQRYSLAAAPTLLGAVALPAHAGAMINVGDTLVGVAPEPDFVLEPTQADGCLVDVSDSSAPSVASLPGSATLAAFGERLVGLGSAADGSVVIQSWDVSVPGMPVVSSTASTPWPFTVNAGMGPEGRSWGFSLDAVGTSATLLYPYGVFDNATGEVFTRLGVAAMNEANISVQAVAGDGVFSSEPIANAVSAYTSSNEGVSAVPLADPSGAVTLPLYPARTTQIVAELDTAGYHATLEQTATGASVVLAAIGDAEAEPARIELEHFGEALVAMGNKLVVLGLQRFSECDFVVELGLPEGDLFCPTPNLAGFTVIDLSGAPSVEQSQLLPTDFEAPEVPANASVRTTFAGYVRLDERRLALPASRFTLCESRTACESLGIEGSEGMATPGCNPQTQDCAALPQVITFFSGGRQEQLVYTLDVGDSSSSAVLSAPATLAAPVDLFGEEQLELVNDSLQSSGSLAFRRVEYVQDASGEPLMDAAGGQVVRHFIERVRRNDGGVLEFDSSLNVPGRAILLTEDGDTLYSIEPRAASPEVINAVLHRSRLTATGAFIEETLDLGAGFRDATSVGGQLVLLFGEPVCTTQAPVSRVFSVRLPEAGASTPMQLSEPLDLPRENWSFAVFDRPWPQGSALLRGGPTQSSGRLELGLGAPGDTPSVRRYYVQAPF